MGPHPLQGSLDQSPQTRKSQTLQITHLHSFLHCHQLIKSSDCLSHHCQIPICLRLSWILLPCPVYSAHRAHNSPGRTCVSLTRDPGCGGSSSAALSTLSLPCWLNVSGEPKDCQISFDDLDSYPCSATYDLWTPASAPVKWGHNTNIAMQLWWLDDPAFESALMHNRCAFAPFLPASDAFSLPTLLCKCRRHCTKWISH